MESQRVEHTIEPVFDGRSEVLVLGTMPSPKSREVGFYYGHPQNRFWRVMAALFDEPVELLAAAKEGKRTRDRALGVKALPGEGCQGKVGGETAAKGCEDKANSESVAPAGPSEAALVNARRIDFLLRHHIALWDVLASCDIAGASDASIDNAQVNDLLRITSRAPIKMVFCTGAKSAELYRRHCEAAVGIPCVQLPSTSPANAAWSLERLIGAYAPLAEAVGCARPQSSRVLPVEDVVALERRIDAAGTSLAELMERAGLWLAYRVHKRAGQGRVAVLCGNGNNGGDGWVCARYLAAWGHEVTVVSAKEPSEIKAHPAREAALRASEELGAERLLIDPRQEEVRHAMEGAVIVDAILGTGFAHDEVREPFATWITLVNEMREAACVIAADVPSGLNADTADAARTTIVADETVTMIVGKPGLFAAGAERFCGEVFVAPLAYLGEC